MELCRTKVVILCRTPKARYTTGLEVSVHGYCSLVKMRLKNNMCVVSGGIFVVLACCARIYFTITHRMVCSAMRLLHYEINSLCLQ